jgi:sortase A
VVEIGSIEIPAIGVHHRIFQGVTLHNIDRGPSHWTGSALPGERGNTVFAGHRATYSQPFRRIDALVPGDSVIFTVDGARSTYRVTGHMVVRPADTWIAIQTSAYTGTLYACHPVGSMAERYVVRLELVP